MQEPLRACLRGGSRRSFVAVLFSLCICAPPAFLTGCEGVTRLRRLVQGESAGIHLQVEPAAGISILLDGQQAATRSPYVDKTLGPGSHVLDIRAPGYYPVRLPFELSAGEMVRVPVELRQKPQTSGRSDGDNSQPARESLAPKLPPGLPPIALSVTADPPATVLVDGYAAAGKNIRLERIYGTLSAGGLTLGYRLVGADGLLEMTIPQDGAGWSRDGVIVLPGNSFRLLQGAGATRIMRVAGDNVPQSIIIHR